MILNFDNIDSVVNNTGIATFNASLSTNNSISAAYILGYQLPINQLAYGSIKTIFKYDYIPEINSEPNFYNTNKIKSMINDSGYLGERTELAGIVSFNSFLDNYSLKIQPNNIIQASVSYATFVPVTGVLTHKNNFTDYLKDGSFAHSWTTYISNAGINKKDIYDFSYDFKANWFPVYVVGNKYPVEVKLLNAEESISFVIDEYKNILFTGENIYGNILNSGDGIVRFKNLSLVCQDNCEVSGFDAGKLSLNLDGFKIKNIDIISQTDQYLRVSYQASKFY